MLDDVTVWVYGATVLVSVYSFCLFFWWLGKNSWRVSYMFTYIMLLFGGLAFCYTLNLYARVMIHADPMVYVEMSNSIWWPLRPVPLLVILIMIAVHMSYRAFWLRNRLGD